jgi:acetaldehyde dehydrogenase/alcohol dehydrogenase
MGENTLVDRVLEQARAAAAVFSQLSQEQVDRIVKAACDAALDNRVRLARMAYEETGMGKWEDKVVKNVVGSLYVYDSIRHEKTVGIIANDEAEGLCEIAQPIGPILAVIPCTNPTSTVMFKVLIALKTRNPIIISAHHRALESCRETVRLMYEAALKEDAPEDCMIFFERESRNDTAELMSDPRLALILATGGEGVVRAAYSSGTPALGVGAGNVPVYIEATADVPFAVEQILISKTFDNGTICASEQALVVEKCIEPAFREELLRRKAYFLDAEQQKAVAAIAYDSERHTMTAGVVGQSAVKVAELAGITVPDDTTVLVAPSDVIGDANPLSSEILCPLLAYYVVEDFDDAVNHCIDLNFHGGIGHSVAIYSNNDARIEAFGLTMNAGRILVNMPSSQGAVGGIYSRLKASFTLGCGTGGKNITMDNVSARHLLNIQRIARRRVNERMLNMDAALLFDETVGAEELGAAYNRNY